MSIGLPDYRTLEQQDDGRQVTIACEYELPPVACPGCGVKNEGAELYRWAVREQEFRDTSIHGKRCALLVRRQRWRCRTCGKLFQDALPGFSDTHRMTERLVQYIERESLERPFAHLAREVGVDDKTIWNVFADHANRLLENYQPETPVWLGMDEIHIMGKARAVLTNLQAGTIIDLLETREKKALLEYLSKMPNRERVELVTMDMWTAYRDLAQLCFPNAVVIIDKFHVVRLASDALERVRKTIRRDLKPGQRKLLMRERSVLLKRKRNLRPADQLKLEEWTSAFPLLGAAYAAKESFYELFDADITPAEAKARYAAWVDALDPEVRGQFNPLIRALKNWEPEIFAYFEHRLANALTEGMNSITRIINNLGRGYSFPVLRVKILFRTPHKVRRGKKVQQVQEILWYDAACGSAAMLKDPDLGASIKAFLELAKGAAKVAEPPAGPPNITVGPPDATGVYDFVVNHEQLAALAAESTEKSG